MSNLSGQFREQLRSDIDQVLARDSTFLANSSRYPNIVTTFGSPDQVQHRVLERKNTEKSGDDGTAEKNEKDGEEDDMLLSALDDLDNLEADI